MKEPEIRRRVAHRLTNGFSKKWENLKAMMAVYFAFYNFVTSKNQDRPVVKAFNNIYAEHLLKKGGLAR